MEGKFNITKENARINQEKSAKKHKENNERRFFLIRSGQDILTSKADVTDDDRMKAAFVGYKYGKKAAVGEKAFIDMLYQAKLDGNYKAFRIGPPSDELKAAMREQAEILGITDGNRAGG